MAARHDVKDLGMAAVKLPDGQQLELPLLQVISSVCNLVVALHTVSLFDDLITYRMQREIGSWTFESFNQREFSDSSLTRMHNGGCQAPASLPHVVIPSV